MPLLADLAAMRSVAVRQGREAKLIEPLVPVDLVVDHSVQVDHYGTPDALRRNMEIEFERNRERYQFMKWGMQLPRPGTVRRAARRRDRLHAQPGARARHHRTAITSCTNTSNPAVMIAAGLLAQKAVARGLRVKPHIKTSLAPGARVVTPLPRQGQAARAARHARLRARRLLLRRLRHGAAAGARHPGRARPAAARRLGHHRPHLARRLLPRDQPGRALAARTGGGQEGLQLLRFAPRQPRRDGARHLCQRAREEPDAATQPRRQPRRGRLHPARRRADHGVRGGERVDGAQRADPRLRGRGVRHRLVATGPPRAPRCSG